MEHINSKLHQLAKRLNLIDDNQQPEPYILTKIEEDNLIEHEIKLEKENMEWRMKDLKYTKDQIDSRLSEVNWNEKINREEVLHRANSIKHQELWLKEKHKKDKEEEERKQKELQEYWTAKQIYNLMARSSVNDFGRKLLVNDDNKKLITAVCFYISNDPRFESELNYQPNRGLLVRGVSGIGKTHIVRCAERNELNPIATLNMIEITDELKAYGVYDINIGNNKIIYLDDVGTEETPAVHFGNKIHFFKNFIESIYLRNTSKNFRNLIISTNLNFKGIEDKYGFRVASRMREMFNVIDVNGTDLRG